MDTEELALRLKDRDQMALKYLYTSYSKALLGVIYRIVGCRDTSEDILQEVYVKIWNNIGQYDADKARLYTWMSRIARNAAIDMRRSKKFENNQANVSLDTDIHNPGTKTTDTASMDINTLTKDLDPKYKEVLEFVYLKGYSHSEAAEALGLPKGTVKTRLRTSLQLLRETLKNEKILFIGAATFIGFLILFALCS